MKFLDAQRIRTNMELAAACILPPSSLRGGLKTNFMHAMNLVQGTTMKPHEGDFGVEFENPQLVKLLAKKGVFLDTEVQDDKHLFYSGERDQISRLIDDAKSLIKSADPNLFSILNQLIGSVAVFRIADRDGGSVSCCIGLIWLSPILQWDTQYCAEMLVHEFVHSSVFLEDMVQGIMPNPELLEHEDAHAISVIRKTRRAYDKSFHSACVGAGIMYLHHALGNDAESDTYVPSMISTVNELKESAAKMAARGMPVLSDNGHEILDGLERFAHRRDYTSISSALAGAPQNAAHRLVA